MPYLHIVVVGGGAAGFFAALQAAAAAPHAQVSLLEKSTKLLSKVRISGGGRCNVTHACFSLSTLSKCYPRGERAMKQLLHRFMTTDTIEWFERRGVALKAEADGRMFPTTDSSETIIECFLREVKKLGVHIQISTDVLKVQPQADGKILLLTEQGKVQKNILADRVIIATGGSPKASGLQWLADLGHQVEPPVPSLFTFNIPNHAALTALMGLSTQGKVKVLGTKLEQEGAILITHWGLSGPAVLKLSAWGARLLAEHQYRFKIAVQWTEHGEVALRELLGQQRESLAARQVGNRNPLGLPARLWEYLLTRIGLSPQKKWAEMSKQEGNRLVNVLVNDEYEVSGKTTFKEEFVTCGGVSLRSVALDTMQSKAVPNLFFAGEVLDIDGITGGFNFQAAWTTAYIAGQAAASADTP